MTAVRFGGVAVPTFRAPEVLSLDLSGVDAIDVQTTSLDELLHASAQAAFDSIGPLTTASRRVAGRIRSGHEGTVLRTLSELTSSVHRLAAVTGALADARTGAAPHGADLAALVVRLRRLVEDMTARQAATDWIGVADLLERELLPTFDAWVAVTRRIWKTV